MLYFTVDPRDGMPPAMNGTSGSYGSGCNTCCCQPIRMMPGETNMVVINYAPWSVPLAPPGIVPLFTHSIEASCDACPEEVASNTNYYFDAPDAANTFTLATNQASTVATTFSYEIVSLSGPTHGQIVLNSAAPGEFTYTPFGGYTGYDYFSYKMTDDQGNEVTRHVQINVGGATGTPDFEKMSLVPYIFSNKVVTDQRMQEVQIPIYIPLSARPCETFRLTIKQPAKNCDCQMFYNISCFDIIISACGK